MSNAGPRKEYSLQTRRNFQNQGENLPNATSGIQTKIPLAINLHCWGHLRHSKVSLLAYIKCVNDGLSLKGNKDA